VAKVGEYEDEGIVKDMPIHQCNNMGELRVMWNLTTKYSK
jgi:hypothetical protein